MKNIDKKNITGSPYPVKRYILVEDVLGLIDEFDKGFNKNTSQSFIACWDCIKEELKKRITG